MKRAEFLRGLAQASVRQSSDEAVVKNLGLDALRGNIFDEFFNVILKTIKKNQPLF